MSSAPSLYRRHRPRSFADVVGQEPVVRTLRHAVERGQVHHAYLFVGSRGTGKTSMAKILAACLNCERGPTIDPCGVCESCRAIASASSLDVIEMDAASNNSVDDIRELRDSVAYAPVSGRSKVYILDEAHMLSTAAWNAFLKTLEEPPPDTIFVLATTEAQKVPATVVDRCHRFDFQRPTAEQIAVVLRRTAAQESIEIPPQAVAAVARAATGSFRDALGTLEQLVTYSGPTIQLEDVLAVLGVADAELVHEAFDAVSAADPRRALLAIQRCSDSGRDASSFASDLETRARELLVVQVLGDVPAELSITPEADAALAEQAERLPANAVVRVLELLAAALEAIRAGADPRTQLELALVKAATPEVDASTRALLARIERLEAALAAGASARQAAPSAADAANSLTAHRAAPSGRDAAPAVAPGQAASAPAAVEAATPGPARQPAALDSPPSAGAGGAHHDVGAPAAAVAEALVPPVVAAPDAGAGPVDLELMRSLWPAVLEAVRAENTLTAALLADARPVALDGDELTVAFAASEPFLKKKAEDPANRAIVGEALRQVSGRRLRPLYELRDDLPPAVAGEQPSEEEWVARFMSEFDAEELPVTPPEGT